MMIFAMITSRSGLDELLLATMITAFIVISGAHFFQVRRMIRYLRRKHPEAAKKLIVRTRLIFLRNNTQCLGLHDPEFDRMFHSKKRFEAVASTIFCLIIGTLFLLGAKLR